MNTYRIPARLMFGMRWKLSAFGLLYFNTKVFQFLGAMLHQYAMHDIAEHNIVQFVCLVHGLLMRMVEELIILEGSMS